MLKSHVPKICVKQIRVNQGVNLFYFLQEKANCERVPGSCMAGPQRRGTPFPLPPNVKNPHSRLCPRASAQNQPRKGPRTPWGRWGASWGS